MTQAAGAVASDQVITLERVPFGTDVAEVATAIGRAGGVILTGALTRPQVDAVNRELDASMGAIPQGNFGKGEQNYLADFMGARTKRLVHCVCAIARPIGRSCWAAWCWPSTSQRWCPAKRGAIP